MATYEYTCPCGGNMKTENFRIYEEFVKNHSAEHIEKVLELKSKTLSLPSLSPHLIGQTNYTPCSYQVIVTG